MGRPEDPLIKNGTVERDGIRLSMNTRMICIRRFGMKIRMNQATRKIKALLMDKFSSVSPFPLYIGQFRADMKGPADVARRMETLGNARR